MPRACPNRTINVRENVPWSNPLIRLNSKILRYIDVIHASRHQELPKNYKEALRFIIKAEKKKNAWIELKLLPNILEIYMEKLDLQPGERDTNIVVVIVVDVCLRLLYLNDFITKTQMSMYIKNLYEQWSYPPGPLQIVVDNFEEYKLMKSTATEVSYRYLRGAPIARKGTN